jgi:hypothetical protein
MKRAGRTAAVLEIEIPGDLDSHTLEALWLELRRVAKRYGVEIEDFRAGGVVDDFSA